MNSYSLKEIAEITGGELSGKSNLEIRNISIDSRTIIKSPTTLFFAIQGENHDGHIYINELYNKGIRGFVVSKLSENHLTCKNAGFILVPDTLTALQQFTGWHRRQFPDISIVGITGSNGKTVVKEWFFQLLAETKKVLRNPRSYNSQVGVPLSVWLLNANIEIAAFEAGISKPDEMNKLENIIRPDFGIFTNIGDAHQENFISVEQKINEKIQLFKQCKSVVFCCDNAKVTEAMQNLSQQHSISLHCWSFRHKADLQIISIEKQRNCSTINAIFKQKETEITIPFTDKASVENSINLWLLLLVMKFNESFIRKRMLLLSSVSMRLELVDGKNNCIIINDSYNSDIESLKIALDFTDQQNQHQRKTVILSDILQSGYNSNELYEKVAELIKEHTIGRVIGIGKNFLKYAGCFPIEKHFFGTTGEFLRELNKIEFKNEAVLLKGARSFAFEQISDALQYKKHRTVLEVNLNAIIHNLNYFRSKLHPDTKIMAMVKAFSYGNGSYEIANLLQFQNIDYLGVAYIDEGIELRNSGIKLPIFIMNPDFDNCETMLDYQLEPDVYSLESLQKVIVFTKKRKIEHFPVHIEIETGMNRLGFQEKEIDLLTRELNTCKSLKIKSIFSHLATSDEPQQDNYTRKQIECFDNLSNRIIKKINRSVMRHLLNSAGIERFPEAQYNMVRLGIGLYGISSVNQDNLRNISTLKCRVSQIKNIESTESIGYSRKGKLDKNGRIGIISIGYADGLNRGLSNGKGKVIVNGKFAPIVGNICMDMCMIDLTGIEAGVGDEATIFGDDYPVSEIARLLETIPYEVMTSISRRVKNVYYQE